MGWEEHEGDWLDGKSGRLQPHLSWASYTPLWAKPAEPVITDRRLAFFSERRTHVRQAKPYMFFSLLASEMFTAAMTVGSVGYTNDTISRTACNPLNTNVWLLLNRFRIMKPRVRWLIIGRKSRYSHSIRKKLAPTKQACRTVHRRIQDFTIEGVHVVGAGPAVRGTSVLQKLKQSVELVYNL